jgi:hypothetical protein
VREETKDRIKDQTKKNMEAIARWNMKAVAQWFKTSAVPPAVGMCCCLLFLCIIAGAAQLAVLIIIAFSIVGILAVMDGMHANDESSGADIKRSHEDGGAD